METERDTKKMVYAVMNKWYKTVLKYFEIMVLV